MVILIIFLPLFVHIYVIIHPTIKKTIWYSLCSKKAHFLPIFILCNFHAQNSLSLLHSLYTIHLLVCEIQEWLFCLHAHKKSVCFCWVPSEAGITGHERADSLAHSVTILGCHPFTKVPTCDYFHSFCSFLFSRWQSFWSDLSNNKLCAVKPSASPWSDPGHKNRWWETVFARLRIGHTNLTHSYLMTQSPLTLCMTCNTLLSVPHILLFCPCYTAARATAFNHLSQLSPPPRLNNILTESPYFHLGNTIFFLQQIYILHLI